MKFHLFAYVVMPTHLRFLFEPSEAGLTANLRDFKSKSALLLSRQRHHPGPFWQPRFFDVIGRRAKDFREKRWHRESSRRLPVVQCGKGCMPRNFAHP
jgi:REP element-mobilizing transposase RayT